jgi:hypothetical protein
VLSGTSDLISCDFVPMIWDKAPLLTRPCARLSKLPCSRRRKLDSEIADTASAKQRVGKDVCVRAVANCPVSSVPPPRSWR